MYFESRTAAGLLLANRLQAYQGQPVAVVALGDGAVLIGAQIALKLHASLGMLLSAAIDLPRETKAIGGITESGDFAYSSALSQGEIDELLSEYRGYLEEEKFNKLSRLHQESGTQGLIRKSLLRDHTVIIASDGLKGVYHLDIMASFFKPLRVKKLIIAAPFADVPAVDRMHMISDEICCLNVLQDYISTDHYYEDPSIPPHATIVQTVATIQAHWQ